MSNASKIGIAIIVIIILFVIGWLLFGRTAPLDNQMPYPEASSTVVNQYYR